MTYETIRELDAEIPKQDRVHFTQCEDCKKWFDMRSFDDVAFHCFGHVERPDFNVKPGVRIK